MNINLAGKKGSDTLTNKTPDPKGELTSEGEEVSLVA